MKVFRSKATRLLSVSLVAAILVCTCIFSVLAFHMSSQSTLTINEVGGFYMSSMSQQISSHFETTITLQLEQVEALVNTEVSERIHEDPEAQAGLTAYAKALGFEYLGFYTSQNDFDMLYGSPLHVTDPESFMNSLAAGEKKAAIGTDEEGNSVILLGIPSLTFPLSSIPVLPWWPRFLSPISTRPCPWTRTMSTFIPLLSAGKVPLLYIPRMRIGTTILTGH